jgi:peroxiredoxin
VQLQENYAAIQAKGAEVVAVVVASVEAVEGLCERAGVDYPILADESHEVSGTYGVYDLLGDGLAAPAVFIIDADRRVVWSQIGQRTSLAVPGTMILEQLP